MKKEFNYAFPLSGHKIRSLGILWRAQYYWRLLGKSTNQARYVLVEKNQIFQNTIPAYSLAELGQMIPFGYFNQMRIEKYLDGVFSVQLSDGKWKSFSTEAEARAAYLIDLVVSGKAKVEEFMHPQNEMRISEDKPF